MASMHAWHDVLETQEQFPVKAGIQNADETMDFNSWTSTFAGVTNLLFNDLLICVHLRLNAVFRLILK